MRPKIPSWIDAAVKALESVIHNPSSPSMIRKAWSDYLQQPGLEAADYLTIVQPQASPADANRSRGRREPSTEKAGKQT